METTEPLEIYDFTGGLTDHALGGGPNEYLRSDNLLFDEVGKPYSRPGSRLFDVANAQLPSGNQRVGALLNYGDDTALLAQSARHLYQYSAGWTELTGPSGNPVLGVATTAGRISAAQWKGHLFVVNNEYASPIKIYRDAAGNYQVRNNGLPKFKGASLYTGTTATAQVVALANDLRTQFLAHYADTVTSHPTGADTVSAALITSGAISTSSTLAQTITLVTGLMNAYKNHYTDALKATGSRLYHSNSLGDYPGAPNVLLQYPTPPTTWIEVALALNDLKLKYGWHTRSFKGHPAVAGPPVTAADLNTAQDPVFATIDYSKAIALANDLKARFNAHINDNVYAHPVTAAFADVQDGFSSVTLTDATDLNSLRELTCHLYAAYRVHHADIAEKWFNVTGVTDHTTLNQISNIQPVFNNTQNGSIADLKVGQYKAYSAAGNAFPAGTKILAIVGTTLTMSNNHNSGGATPSTDGYVFAKEAYHAGARSNDPTPTKGDLADFAFYDITHDFPTLVSALNDILSKYNYHDASGALDGVTPKWHKYGSTNQCRLDPLDVAINTYEYAFLWSYEYTTLEGETFRMASAPLFATFQNFTSPDLTPVSISNLPSISNGATENYDTANINIEIYRTVAAGLVPTLIGKIPNGTTTFIDNFADLDLANQEAIYTDGGVLDNDPPPAARILHITSLNYAYYGNIKDDTGTFLPNRIVQAVADDPSSAPGSNAVDLPDAVLGISSIRGIPVAWTSQATYRLEGAFDELGRGSIQHVAISDTVGLGGSYGVVQVDDGIVFAGSDGIYFTDAYRVVKLTEHWPATYLNLISTQARKDNIQATFDHIYSRVFFAVTGSGSENDSMYVLDLRAGVKPNSAFTTWSGGTDFAPTSVCIFNGSLLRGDSRGYVFKHDDSYLSDPKVNLGVAASQWLKRAVIYDYKSTAFDFGTTKYRKWVTRIVAKFDNLGDVSVQINSINDLGKLTQSLTPIRARSITGLIEQKRYFPSGGLRCSNKQIEFTNAKVVIENSSVKGVATVDPVAKTVTLAAGWVVDADDYVVAFANDSYVQEFTVLSQTATILIVSDPGNLLPVAGNYAWVMRGIPKTERMKLLQYCVMFNVLGESQTQVSAGVSGTGEP